jgi:hypothetical protein
MSSPNSTEHSVEIPPAFLGLGRPRVPPAVLNQKISKSLSPLLDPKAPALDQSTRMFICETIDDLLLENDLHVPSDDSPTLRERSNQSKDALRRVRAGKLLPEESLQVVGLFHCLKAANADQLKLVGKGVDLRPPS